MPKSFRAVLAAGMKRAGHTFVSPGTGVVISEEFAQQLIDAGIARLTDDDRLVLAC
jgi:hypothetical protein